MEKRIIDGEEYVLWTDIQPVLLAAGKMYLQIQKIFRLEIPTLRGLGEAMENYDREIIAISDWQDPTAKKED